MLRFEQSRLIFYKDIERCPYSMRESEAIEWFRRDDRRLLLIALERYLMIFDYLGKTHQYLKENSDTQIDDLCRRMMKK